MTIYKQKRDNIRNVKKAIDELKAASVLISYTEEDVKGDSGRIEDVRFILYPSANFSEEMRRANWRQQKIGEEAERMGLTKSSLQAKPVTIRLGRVGRSSGRGKISSD